MHLSGRPPTPNQHPPMPAFETGSTAPATTENAGTPALMVPGKVVPLGGPGAANYALPDTTITLANITQLGIQLTAVGRNKVYDGTTAADVTLASKGVLAGDNVLFSASASYADPTWVRANQ